MGSGFLIFSKEVLLVGMMITSILYFRFLGSLFVGVGLAGVVTPLFEGIVSFQMILIALSLIVGFLISPSLSNEQPLFFILFSIVGVSVLLMNWDLFLSFLSSFHMPQWEMPHIHIPFPDVDIKPILKS